MEISDDALVKLIIEGKNGNHMAQEQLITMFTPMLNNLSSTNKHTDTDCFQELSKEFIRLLEKFEPVKYIR